MIQKFKNKKLMLYKQRNKPNKKELGELKKILRPELMKFKKFFNRKYKIFKKN